MLNFEWCQMEVFLPGDCEEFLPDASHRVRGAGLGDPRSDAPGLSLRVNLSSLLEWRGGGLLRSSGGGKQFAVQKLEPTPHGQWEKFEA